MDIARRNIKHCIENTIQGVNDKNKILIKIAEKLKKGDICIIRETSSGGNYRYGVRGLWYFLEREDIVGKIEPNWIEKTGWKYKIHMKPLIHEFDSIFEEDFSIEIPGQLRQKLSSKIPGLTQPQLQGAIKRFKDYELVLKYLRGIIEEKKSECDIEVEYENTNGKKRLNVYKFLDDLIRESTSIEKNEWVKSSKLEKKQYVSRIESLGILAINDLEEEVDILREIKDELKAQEKFKEFVEKNKQLENYLKENDLYIKE